MVGNICLLDHRYHYEYKGFTSILNHIIELSYLHYSIYGNYNVKISDSQVLEFFNPVVENFEKNEFYNLSDIFFEQLSENKFVLQEFNAHTEANLDDLKKRNINNILQLKPYYLEKINNLKSKLFKDYRVIGIHIRGTDKSKEVPRIPIEKIFNHINTVISNKGPYDKLFVATDEYSYLNELIKNYGEDFIIYNESNIISHDGNPLHFNNDLEYKKKINFEVLSDSFLLSECDFFLYCFSNVSLLSLSLMINPENKIKNINS